MEGEKKRIHPGSENLIPVTKRTKEEARIISAKGGRGNKNNPKSKLAARIREMKKKGLTTESEKLIYNMITDYNMSELYVLEYINKLITSASNNQELNVAVGRMMEWHKLKHGTKEHNKKIEIGITLSKEEKEEELIRLLK